MPLHNSRCFQVLFVYQVMAAFVQGFQRINVVAVSMPADLKGGRVFRKNQKRELHSCSLLFFESDWVCLTCRTCRHSACGMAGCWRIKFALRNYREKFITHVSRVRITLCLVFYENPGGHTTLIRGGT